MSPVPDPLGPDTLVALNRRNKDFQIYKQLHGRLYRCERLCSLHTGRVTERKPPSPKSFPPHSAPLPPPLSTHRALSPCRHTVCVLWASSLVNQAVQNRRLNIVGASQTVPKYEGSWYWLWIEFAFNLIFTIEMVVRLCVAKTYARIVKDVYFIFDCAAVIPFGSRSVLSP